ncbi:MULTISPECIES: hypothetical protein [unclassified Lysinibacillus]|uniref:hypothetical protein n=1 Tax=unclassified Lysinibacillus TaxID=2636778 RepID=UPI00381BD2F0
MRFHYHMYWLERFTSVNIIRIQEFIEDYLKMKSVKDVLKQISEGEIIFLVHTETNIFEELASSK